MNNNRFAECEVRDYLDAYRCILNEMICNMDGACQNNSISFNFISRMIPHHEAAIEMCENLLKYTDNQSLKCICKNIISEQTRSIANMKKLMDNATRFCSSKNCLMAYTSADRAIAEKMFSCMKCAKSTDCINCNFLREMLPHHEGAVAMSENLLKYDICPGLIPIAKNIIKSQEQGICQMKNLLCELDCCK